MCDVSLTCHGRHLGCVNPPTLIKPARQEGRSSLGQLYMTEMEVKRALLADPDDLDLQEAMRELKSLEKEVHKDQKKASIPQIRSKADVPAALARIIKEREQLFSKEQANQMVR